MMLLLVYLAVCYVMGAALFFWLRGERSKLAEPRGDGVDGGARQVAKF